MAKQIHTDEALMRLMVAQREAAFAPLYERYGGRMYRFFYRMLGRDTQKAEDFTQELFLKIIEKPEAFDPSRSFRTWIYAVAYNLCKNEYRRIQRPEPPAGAQTEEWRPESLDRDYHEQLLRQALEQLSEDHRQCFVLRFQEELSVKEVAEVLNCPEGTVKSRLHYAVQYITARIRQQLAHKTNHL